MVGVIILNTNIATTNMSNLMTINMTKNILISATIKIRKHMYMVTLVIIITIIMITNMTTTITTMANMIMIMITATNTWLIRLTLARSIAMMTSTMEKI